MSLRVLVGVKRAIDYAVKVNLKLLIDLINYFQVYKKNILRSKLNQTVAE
jgi:hypothetical protein